MSRLWILSGIAVALIFAAAVVLVSTGNLKTSTQKLTEQKLTEKQTPSDTQTELQEYPEDQPAPATATSGVSYSAGYLNSLSADEKRVAGLDLTDSAVLEANVELIKSVAKTGDLEIANCEPNPLVYKTSVGSTFKIKNSGSQPYNIQSGSAVDVTVPGGYVRSVTANFDGPGVYTYSCGTHPKGLFLITP